MVPSTLQNLLDKLSQLPKNLLQHQNLGDLLQLMLLQHLLQHVQVHLLY